tara:strand:- start:54 stop:893 length:840 start_codon:yes stop_codon:yes gene_type:complete
MLDVLYVAIASVAAGILSLLVAVILVQKSSWAGYLIKFGTPFAAGVLLIASFRDLIPHGIEEKGSVVLNATLIAIIIFFLIEKGFKAFHHHHEEDLEDNRNTSQGWLFLIGSVFHNAIDGIALGSAFLIDSGTGIIATVAIIAHNIPLEVGEFGLQLKSGFSKKQTIMRNLIASSTLLIGAMCAFQIGSFVELPLGYIYGGIAGFFIYIALSDIVPTIHSSESKRYGLQTGFLIFGLFFGVIVSSFAHQYLDVTHEHASASDHSSHEGESDSDHSSPEG